MIIKIYKFYTLKMIHSDIWSQAESKAQDSQSENTLKMKEEGSDSLCAFRERISFKA